jgi:hypothetical protein
VTDTADDDRPPRDATLADRRRKGRMNYQNAHLIALLRGQSFDIDPAETEANLEALSVDDLAPTRGIARGVSIGTAIWTAIIFAVWHFM